MNTTRILVTGDIMMHDPQLEYFDKLRKECSDDVRYMTTKLFDQSIIDLFQSSEVVLGNLETVINDNLTYQGYPKFNSPYLFLQILKELGFTDLVVTNNHSKDHTYATWLKTVEEIEALNIRTHGSDPFHVKSLKNLLDIKVYAGSDRFNKSFDEITDEQVLSKQYQPVNKQQFIKLLESFEAKVDKKLIYFHSGKEYFSKISSDQAEILTHIYKNYFNLAIILSHSHVLGTEFQRTKFGPKLENGLGNFSSMQESLDRQIGTIVEYSYNKWTDEFLFVKHHLIETVLHEDGSYKTIKLFN